MKPHNSKATLWSQWHIVKRCIRLLEQADRHCFLRQILSDTFYTLLGYLNIFLAATVVDAVNAKKPIQFILLLAGAISALNFLCWTVSRLIRRRYQCHNFHLLKNLRRFLWEKVMSLDYTRIEDTKTQDQFNNARRQLWNGNTGLRAVYYRIIGAVGGFLQLIIGVIYIAPIAIAKPIVHNGWIGFFQSPLGLLTLLLLVALLELFKATYINRKFLESFEKIQNSKENTQARRVLDTYEWFVLDNYRNGKEIRIYEEQDLILSEYDKAVEMQIQDWVKAYRKSRPHSFTWQMLNVVTRILMYGLAVIRAATGMLSPGEVIAFALYFTQIQDGVSELSDGLTCLKLTPTFCKQIFDFLDIPDEKYKGTIPTEKRDDNEYQFEFKHVSFRYPGAEQDALHDINLKWHIGKKMALVGKNGCGKSTLVKLLCRLYDPTAGVITLNGIDIRKYDYEEYMALFSVVFQDSKLFSFPLVENVAADTIYDAVRAEDCIRRSGLSEWLDTMPDGIQTCLYKDFDEHGVEISGGEAQKIMLARAIYKGAAFLVLDEPTASLDPISEHDIYTKFNNIAGTRTAIYISHRLSSCRFCDEITVMENGTIAERGTHDQLLKRGGVYQSLWKAQAEYYKDTAGELFA